jgi:hypothetical protein
VTAPESDVSPLLQALERGPPEGHALVLAATDVDGRHPLSSSRRSRARSWSGRWVADGSGTWTLSGASKSFLEGTGKRLGPARRRRCATASADRCGCSSPSWRSWWPTSRGRSPPRGRGGGGWPGVREEEYLELSDALQKRDLAAALRYVDEALEHGAAPLMILGAVASVVRGLVESHERMAQLGRGQPPRSFDEFKSRIFPGWSARRSSTDNGCRTPGRPSWGCRPPPGTDARRCAGVCSPAPRPTWRSSPPGREARARAAVVDGVPSRARAGMRPDSPGSNRRRSGLTSRRGSGFNPVCLRCR